MAAQQYAAIQLSDSEEDDEELVLHDSIPKKDDLPKASDDLKFHDQTDISMLPTVEGTSTKWSSAEDSEIINPTKTMLIGEDSSDDETDRTELLAGQKKPPSFWTFEYYQKFFDVDTKQVLTRILYSMVPSYGRNFLTSKVRPNPDLYGPFWICATLVFTIAISGNLSSYFASQGSSEWVYDFHKVTFAAFVIYGYAWLIPSALWGCLMWRGNQAGFMFLEIVCVYGYSLSIFVPISILWVLPQDWLRWTLVIVGVILSGSVLCLTFYRAIEDDNRKIIIATLCTIILLHTAVAIGFKLYFFKTRMMLPQIQTQTIYTTASVITQHQS